MPFPSYDIENFAHIWQAELGEALQIDTAHMEAERLLTLLREMQRYPGSHESNPLRGSPALTESEATKCGRTSKVVSTCLASHHAASKKP